MPSAGPAPALAPHAALAPSSGWSAGGVAGVLLLAGAAFAAGLAVGRRSKPAGSAAYEDLE